MMLEFARGFGLVLAYFVLCVAGVLLLRRLAPPPKEVFRKTLHHIVLCSLFLWVYGFETWWMSPLAALLFVALVFPALSLAERIPGYSELLTERKPGEIKASLVAVFLMFAALISLCWGWLQERWLVFPCVFAWGFGDAAAALVGKKFGKHPLEGRLIEGRKSVEGTLAMFGVSFLSVLVILLVRSPAAWQSSLVIALLAAAVCALVELYTLRGMDTLTCPLAAAAVILPLVRLWGV